MEEENRMEKLGEILAELRLDKKMTQKELAQVLHVSIGTISNYEKGAHFPDIEKLINLADFFGVTTDYLLGRSKYNLSPDVFSEAIIEDKTAGDFIKILRQLPIESKKAISWILSIMEFHMTVSQYGTKEKI